MIRQRYRDEFEGEGAEAVRKQVELGSYTEQGKTEQAIKWLNQQGAQRKTYRAVKKQLALARRTARETRLAVVLLTLILIISIFELLIHYTARVGQ
jgi:hypothetical protein